MFSVVIPAYNCENTIKCVLDSVLFQTRLDLIEEIIIINDGSTDSSDKVIRDYIKEHPQINIDYYTQKNHGASYTRNKAIRMAKAEWIALLDSDDVWVPEKIERQSYIISQQENIVFLGAHYPIKFLFRSYKKGLHKINAKQLCLRSLPTTPSVVFKKKIGLELGLFDEKMQYCEDINFFQKFLLVDSFYVLAEKLVNISIRKSYTGQSGMSSNLRLMAKGRDYNTAQLCHMGLISKPYMILMLIMNQMKFIKRCIQNKIMFLYYKIRNQ